MSNQYSIKYRPATLDEMVVGNPDVLVKAEAMARDAQAILITGRSGAGKTTLGYILNTLINGDKAAASLIEINCSEQRGIDSIRALQERLNYRPAGKKTVVLLDEAHSWTAQSASALLKIIENPPHKNILFLIVTDQPFKLLGSIVNRCRQLTIEPPEDRDLSRYLYRIAKRQKLDMDEKELRRICLKIARAADCVPRMAMQYLQDAVDLIRAGKTYKEVTTIVTASEEANLDKLVGSTLIAIYSVAKGEADAEEAIKWFLSSLPADAMGFLMRLQSANFYAAITSTGKFDWRGKVGDAALNAKSLTPTLPQRMYVSEWLNGIRETLKEPASDPAILIGTGVSNLMYALGKRSA